MDNDLNIGLAFSGGGYRAATFDLGALSMLNAIRLEDGRTLLDCVTALSSVSGGSITALKYMLARARGQQVGEMIEELYGFLCNEDLVGRALLGLSAEKANRNASSIKIMAGIYDERLFGGAVMGDIIDNLDKIPVKDFTALATDFDNSLPFRFRITEGRMTDGQILTYGVFGNQQHNIGRSVVRHITLGEALACSSCFPSGFEPMMYPDDFKVSRQTDVATDVKKRFGIMDGGVVDNQGVDPILLAEERMRKYREDKSRTDKSLDLIIISDVASPYMDGYAPCEQVMPQSIGKLTIGRLRNYGLITQFAVMVLLIVAIVLGSGFWTGVMAVITAIVSLANVLGALLKKKMFRAIGATFVGDNAAFVSHLKFAALEAMLMNRAKSVIMMSSEVFLKRLRQLSYGSVYDNKEWHNRAVTSTIYELRPGERWKGNAKKEGLSGTLLPSEAMQQTSARAAGMGTTLWFTPEEKAAGMPADIMATGQFTMCYNLLDYISKIENDPTNLTAGHDIIKACKKQLQEAWAKFQQDPHWMLPK